MQSKHGKLSYGLIIEQVEDCLRLFSAFRSYEVVDATESTVKIKIYIRRDIYVQLYANSFKDKLNLALIHGDERIYGEDSEGGVLHVHPFDDHLSHVISNEKISVEAFLAKVQEFLEIEGLV